MLDLSSVGLEWQSTRTDKHTPNLRQFCTSSRSLECTKPNVKNSLRCWSDWNQIGVPWSNLNDATRVLCTQYVLRIRRPSHVRDGVHTSEGGYDLMTKLSPEIRTPRLKMLASFCTSAQEENHTSRSFASRIRSLVSSACEKENQISGQYKRFKLSRKLNYLIKNISKHTQAMKAPSGEYCSLPLYSTNSVKSIWPRFPTFDACYWTVRSQAPKESFRHWKQAEIDFWWISQTPSLILSFQYHTSSEAEKLKISLRMNMVLILQFYMLSLP